MPKSPKKQENQSQMSKNLPLSVISDSSATQTASDNMILEQLDDSSNETISEATPPSVLGEQSVSGDMTDVESDDDTLLNSHQVGLRVDEDYDNPKPLNMAKDVREAEKRRRNR